ncbi:MAG: hypothetical protein PUC26_00065 [Eubacteriales bacterium]|nr:hypothetical protein [Eubacteriales bacterium]
MYIKQISVFLENTTGRLTDFTAVLKKNNVDIRAMYVADTTDFGILRVLVDDPEGTKKILSENGFNATVTDVIAVEVEDRPGGLHDVLEELTSRNIGVEYIYSTLQLKNGKVVLVLKVRDLVKAQSILSEAGVRMFATEDLA